jgi:hypothetical protein
MSIKASDVGEWLLGSGPSLSRGEYTLLPMSGVSEKYARSTRHGGPRARRRHNRVNVNKSPAYSVVREVGIRLRETGAVGSCVELNALRSRLRRWPHT